ncbi:hypothetical protein H7K05_22705 [Priestia aryabhattai]|uniref:hypothetical protein n=1 Tax=Priestia TaxID=2800373 RepID=UPI0014556858|nr:hypothetical protein [Priestia aryabhattai]MBY0008141.1 hypothetical protein [Priestia aryabhattai]MBY0049944.1 hypothetical protein [Priestia aryabhattai]NLR46915.1 hypothetical protein [Priestia megaterium]
MIKVWNFLSTIGMIGVLASFTKIDFFDKYSLWFAILLLVSVVARFLTRQISK